MTYPMPPELLDQLGLEPCADTDPQWPEDHNTLAWDRRPATRGEREELDDHDHQSAEGRRMVADVAQLYDELAPRLRCIVRRDVHAPAVVIEDACQFAWYRLVRHAHHIEQRGALSWLAKTAVHEAIKLARRDQRELSLEARLEETGELNFPDPTPAPHEQVESRERLELVGKLPLPQQRLLWQRAVGFSYEEIALERGLSVRAVERGIHCGRSRLRRAA